SLTFAASSPTTYAGAYYTGRLASDSAGTTEPVQTLAAGLDYYYRGFGSRKRWGDYSGISIDPTDNATFWIYGEYAQTRGTVLTQYPSEDGRWGTRIGKFSFAATPSGSIAGTVFQDNNSSGTQDGGETGINGVTVYLDANNNGSLDLGESSTT